MKTQGEKWKLKTRKFGAKICKYDCTCKVYNIAGFYFGILECQKLDKTAQMINDAHGRSSKRD